MKKRKSNDFDSVAWIYDNLSRMIFGDSLLEAQKCFLSTITQGSDILIIGGGTGSLLLEVITINPDCRIWYVDASEKMIGLSRERVSNQGYVDFIHGTERDIPSHKKFDTVITNFYFDLFDQEALRVVIERIKNHLKPDGNWLVTDFVKTARIGDKTLLWLMYTFFRFTSNIDASMLPDWGGEMKRYFAEARSSTFRKGFVKSVVYVGQ